MVPHTCNPSPQEAEAGGFHVCNSSGYILEPVSKKKMLSVIVLTCNLSIMEMETVGL
jgi:hypothetical protein